MNNLTCIKLWQSAPLSIKHRTSVKYPHTQQMRRELFNQHMAISMIEGFESQSKSNLERIECFGRKKLLGREQALG
jgi:hypothetical protein